MAERTLTEQQREILTSYRLSGMANARPLESFHTKTATSQAPTFVIYYSDSNQDFTSVVSLIGASDRHFYLTTVGPAEQASKSKELHQQIMASFRGPEVAKNLPVFSRNSRLAILTAVFFLVLLIIIIVVQVKTGKIKAKKSAKSD